MRAGSVMLRESPNALSQCIDYSLKLAAASKGVVCRKPRRHHKLNEHLFCIHQRQNRHTQQERWQSQRFFLPESTRKWHQIRM